MRRVLSRTLSALVLVLTAGAAAGPIDPPGGPVGSTMKTLRDVEPRIAISAETCPGDADSLFRIAAPGSYYFAGNVAGVGGKSGIEIAASGVTVDLMGFELVGTAGSLYGITIDRGDRHNLTVRNGVVRGWATGVDIGRFGGGGHSLVEAIHATGNSQRGVVAGHGAVVRSCVASANGAEGVQAFGNAMIESCAAHGNGGSGIAAGTAAAERRDQRRPGRGRVWDDRPARQHLVLGVGI